MTSPLVINAINFPDYDHIAPYIRYCAEDRYKVPWVLKSRKIADYEFIFITRGTGRFIVGNRPYDVKANDLILFKPGIFHQGNSISLPFEFLCMHFDLFLSNSGKITAERLVKYRKALFDFPEYVRIDDSSYIHVIMKRIINEVDGGNPGFDTIIKALFVDLIINLMRQTSPAAKKKEYSGKVQEIIDYVKENYMNRIRLSDLSRHVHLESTYISGLFKKSTGCTLSDYIKFYRLSVAKHLLLETDRKIDDIALDAGYCDLHHFSNVFKAQEGIAPSQYRLIKRY